MGDLQRHYSDLLLASCELSLFTLTAKKTLNPPVAGGFPPEKTSNAKWFSVHRVFAVKYYNLPLMIYSHKILCLTQCRVLCTHMNMMKWAETLISPKRICITQFLRVWQHRMNTESDILREKLLYHWEWPLMQRFAEAKPAIQAMTSLTQRRKGRQGDCLGRHWRRWSLSVTYLPRTKWPPFRRRHIQMHFHERKLLYFDSDFTEVCS